MMRITTKLLARLPAARQHPAAVVEGPIGGVMYESACPNCRIVPHLGISNVLDISPMVAIRGGRWCQLTDTSEPFDWETLHSNTHVFYDDYMAGIETDAQDELNTLSAAIRHASITTPYSKTNPHMADANLERLVAAEYTGHGVEHDVSNQQAEEDIVEEIRCSGSSFDQKLHRMIVPQAKVDDAQWNELNALSAAIRHASTPYSNTNPHMADANLERLVAAEYTGHEYTGHGVEHDVSDQQAEEDIVEEIRCYGSANHQDAGQVDHEAHAVGDDELNDDTIHCSLPTPNKKFQAVKPLAFKPIPVDVASLFNAKQRSSSTFSSSSSASLSGPKDIDGPPIASPTSSAAPASTSTPSNEARRPRTWSAKKTTAHQRR